MNQHSTSKTVTFFLTCTLLALLSLACGKPASENPAASNEAPPAAAVDGDSEAPASDAVTFEPAYPADVSTEGLDADDTAQQHTHSHGGESHSHGDGNHSHGDGEHSHDGDEHSHGEEGHSHGDGDEHAH